MSEFWYCLNHHAVEGPEGCSYADRLGPYPTEARSETPAADRGRAVATVS